MLRPTDRAPPYIVPQGKNDKVADAFTILLQQWGPLVEHPQLL